ncbi:ABC transporter permease [Longirhabdus pacifica]|uniref:ABC transporter permease n=1 Tax=Longirhabdus pacifica TaxID=2305227 RepID=UPI0013E8AFF6|nr:ABC transporter permease [Longirhabdus pacifica]
MITSLNRLIKYDFIVFFREPFFALPILVLPGLFYYIFMSIYGIEGTESVGQYIPTYGLLICFLILFFNIGVQYVTEKERGIHKRLTLSSITTFHIILTYIIRGVVLSLVGLTEILFIAVFVFKGQLTDHFILFFLSFLFVIAVTFLFSLSTHNFFKTSNQVYPYTIIMFQYVLFASGLMFPVESIPDAFQFIVYINPFYHMNILLIAVWNGLQVEWNHIVYFAIFILFCFGLLFFKNRRREK